MAWPRRSALIVLVLAACGAAGLLAVGALAHTTRRQTLGVPPQGPAATLRAGQQLCESPVGLADTATGVRFFPLALGRPSPAIAVTVRDLADGRLLGSGRLAAGYARLAPQVVALGHLPAEHEAAICFRNAGPASVVLMGGTVDNRYCHQPNFIYRQVREGCNVFPNPLPLTPGVATVDGRPIPQDIAAELVGPRQSLLGQVPKMMRRATLFRPGFVGVWTWWALLVLCGAALPACLAFAVRRAAPPEPAGPPAA